MEKIQEPSTTTIKEINDTAKLLAIFSEPNKYYPYSTNDLILKLVELNNKLQSENKDQWKWTSTPQNNQPMIAIKRNTSLVTSVM